MITIFDKTSSNCEVFNSYDGQCENKRKVQQCQLLQVNSSARICAQYTALNKFCFRSHRNEIISLVLVITYHFDFQLKFDINKICIFQGFTETLLNNGNVTK